MGAIYERYAKIPIASQLAFQALYSSARKRKKDYTKMHH